jgi:2-polyprenyl-6-methoxyphenol hydroxylase-like FAD-dependent oxidoreductase
MAGSSSDALIVGAGIGGLAAALALCRSGLGVRVLERASDPRELGFALLLAPNAMAALRALGLAEEIRAVGSVLRVGEMRRPNGEVLRRLDAAQVSSVLGEDSVCVLRPALHGALLRAVGAEALELGVQVTGFRQQGADTFLQCEGPNQRRSEVQGQLIIGADGVGSVLRKALHPGEAPPRRSGLLAIRGVARNAVSHLAGVSGAQYFGRGVEAGLSQSSATDVYWFLSLPAPSDAGSRDARALLDRHLGAFHAPFRAIVAATSATDLRVDELLERAPLKHWGQGAVTLLGDAAHPMLPHAGQGAAQALEDAVTLGRTLERHGPNEAALRRYELLRKARTQAVTEIAHRNARMSSLASPLSCWLRDLAVRRMPERILLRSLIDLGRPPEDLAVR